MNVSKRYECDRCGVPTRSVFEGESASGLEYSSQLTGGLHLTASGYYGGFWDTAPFMGDEPIDFRLCHDCSAWLCEQIPKAAGAAKSGHFSSNVQGEGILHNKSDHTHRAYTGVCCKFGVADHSQDEDGPADLQIEETGTDPSKPSEGYEWDEDFGWIEAQDEDDSSGWNWGAAEGPTITRALKNALYTWLIGSSIQPARAICIDCDKHGWTTDSFASLLPGRVSGRWFTGAGTCIECAVKALEA